MPGTVIIGLQWGDEGKGKITDYLAADADLIVRYQGGNNAGHTVVVDGRKFKLHLVPSGILYGSKTCILGNGMVVDPEALCAELDYLKDAGIDTSGLRISPKAHLIMPYHVFLDSREEKERAEDRIGTTKKGIGPAYCDKVDRCGIRVGDLFFPDILRHRIEQNLREKGLTGRFSTDSIFDKYRGLFQRISSLVAPAGRLVSDALKEGKKVLFEGAQGTLLDVDHGTYPYVTSSSPTSGGACLGSGVGPASVDRVVGIVKAYSTRVGEGPFPTELEDETGEKLREAGAEYGTTTGRPRRTGWLDLVALRYAVTVNGVTAIALTKLDVLAGIEPLKICVSYECEGKKLEYYPENPNYLPLCRPVYQDFRPFSNLNKENEVYYNEYVDFIEHYLGVPVEIISVGEQREQTVLRKENAGVAQG